MYAGFLGTKLGKTVSKSDLRNYQRLTNQAVSSIEEPKPDSENYIREKQRYIADLHLKEFRNTVCDNLMITCSRFSPLSILRELIPRVALARPVSIYHQFRESLHPVYVHMHQSKQYLDFKLTEPWMRTYQSLPGRIHPMMQMSSSAGYVLTAITSSDVPMDEPSAWSEDVEIQPKAEQ
jgi:tRNA (adenine-N(1)-)-methyltransferase non-catalytic subunit